MKLGNFSNMPTRLPQEKFEEVVQFLRNMGDCETCVACKVCAINGYSDYDKEPLCKHGLLYEDEWENLRPYLCPNRGTTLVDYLIRLHIPMAISIARRFANVLGIEEAVSIAMLYLTKGVNNFGNLHNNDLPAYLTSTIAYGLRHQVRMKPLIHKPRQVYKVDGCGISVSNTAHKVGKRHTIDLVLDFRQTFSQIIKNEKEKIILDCLIQGKTLKEMAAICKVSVNAIVKSRDSLFKQFQETWRGE